MRIVVAVHHYPPRYLGGAEREAQRYAAGLRARGHQVRVVCVEAVDAGPDGGIGWVDETLDGVPVRRLSFDVDRVPDPDRFEYDNPWIGLHLEELLGEVQPDVLLLVGGYLLSGSVLAAANRLGVPAVVRLTDFWFLCRRITMLRSDGSLSTAPIEPTTCARCLGEEKRRYRLPARVAPLVMRAFWRLRPAAVARVRARLVFLQGQLDAAAAVISPSQFLANVYRSAGFKARIQFIRQGVSMPDVIPARQPADRLRLGYFGQIAEIKGVDLLVRAVRELGGVPLSLTIYGDEGRDWAYAERVRALAAGDPRIDFRGTFQQYGSLEQAMSEVDVVVVPSTWYENSPNVILEAFAFGAPVIAANLGGMAELVRHDESGLLFRPRDARALAQQIARLVNEPGLIDVLRSGIPPIKTAGDVLDEVEAVCARVARPQQAAARGAR